MSRARAACPRSIRAKANKWALTSATISLLTRRIRRDHATRDVSWRRVCATSIKCSPVKLLLNSGLSATEVMLHGLKMSCLCKRVVTKWMLSLRRCNQLLIPVWTTSGRCSFKHPSSPADTSPTSVCRLVTASDSDTKSGVIFSSSPLLLRNQRSHS